MDLFFKTQTQDIFVSAIFRAVKYSGVLHSVYSDQLLWGLGISLSWDLVLKALKAIPLPVVVMPVSPCNGKLWHGCGKTPPPPLTLMLTPCCLAPQAQIRLEFGVLMSKRKYTGGQGREILYN